MASTLACVHAAQERPRAHGLALEAAFPLDGVRTDADDARPGDALAARDLLARFAAVALHVFDLCTGLALARVAGRLAAMLSAR